MNFRHFGQSFMKVKENICELIYIKLLEKQTLQSKLSAFAIIIYRILTVNLRIYILVNIKLILSSYYELAAIIL